MSFIEEKIKEIDTLQQKLENENNDIVDEMDFLTYTILSDKLTKKELTSNAVDLLLQELIQYLL